MRYLYGDLTEFPRQENALELFQRFFDTAIEVLRLDFEVGAKLDSIEQDRSFVAEVLEEIQDFRRAVDLAIQAAVADRSPEEVVAVVAEGAASNLSQYIDEARGRVVAKVEARIRDTQIEIANLRTKIHSWLRSFFVYSGLPVSSHSLKVDLDGMLYQASAEVLDVVGVRCSYSLNTGASTFFATPRRFADLIPGKVEFPIGTRKAWLKKEPVVETMRLDDAVLGNILDNDSFGEFRLTRKGGGLEGLAVRVDKGQGNQVEVWHLDADGQKLPLSEDLPLQGPREQLLKFWNLLFPQVIDLYRFRGDLNSIAIGEKEVVSARLLTDLVGRLVRFWTPTICTIDARSPADTELCLKLEHEGGRREEIYLQKKLLLDKIRSLPASLQTLFDPLNLDPSRAVRTQERRPPVREAPPEASPEDPTNPKHPPPIREALAGDPTNPKLPAPPRESLAADPALEEPTDPNHPGPPKSSG